MEIYNDDCFNVFPKLQDKSIDLFILDLPYGQTACKWDSEIDLEKMWKSIKRIMKPSAVIVFFCTAKFGYTLIHSNPKWFRYDLIWEKSRKVGFLSANKMPLRKHELMYVFSKDQNENKDDIEIERNKELREYAEKVLLHTGKTKNEIIKKLGQGLDHFFRINSSQFAIPIKKNYEKLTELYKLNEMEGYLNYEELQSKYEKPPPKEQSTYNSQKTEGKPYKPNRKTETNVYGNVKLTSDENKGTRHPTSILQFTEDHENIYVFKKEQGTYNPQKTPREKDYKHSGKRSSETHYGNVTECKKMYKKEDGMHPTTILKFKNPSKSLHRTQKPTDLLEWLIKSYSNEGDTIMDFTMGSGSTGIACMNTKRKFIGIEMDKDIFTIAKERFREKENC